MDTYEIVITDSCNRNCPFCYVRKSGNFETDQGIDRFIKGVREMRSGRTDRFQIDVFGGEPFLNFDGVRKVYDAFSKDPMCEVFVTTNGDLVEPWMADAIPDVNLCVSTYDILDGTGVERYRRLCGMFRKSACLYTLTQDDICRFGDLRFIYDSNGLGHSIRLSHDPRSWDGMTCEELYSTVRDIADGELEIYGRDFSNRNPNAPKFVEQHVMRYVSGIFGHHENCQFCTSCDKKVFYGGRFVGPCMRLDGVSLERKGRRCEGCGHSGVCTRGCYAEIKDDVDEKLCTIEKAMFDSVEDFFRKGGSVVEQILCFWHDKIVS